MFDFLGLRTLTVIDRAVNPLMRTKINAMQILDDIPLNDENDLLSFYHLVKPWQK